MKFNEKIAQFIQILSSIDVPGLIMSAPGIGKTSTIELYCKCKDLNLTTLIASQYSSDDILGLQSVIDGKLQRLTPAWFNSMLELSKNGKKNILFIDELSTCDEFIQAPLLNLIFNKSLGLHKLPEETIIIAAGNYPEDLNNSFSMTGPLVNRFMVLNLSSNDVDLAELLSDKFSSLKSRSDIENFLGLYSNASQFNESPTYLKVLGKADLTRSEFKNSKSTGLIGFSSVRSISNSSSYIKQACALGLMNRNAFKVISDTLGETAGGGTFEDALVEVSVRIQRQDKKSRQSDLVNNLQSGDMLMVNDTVMYLTDHPELVTEVMYSVIKNRRGTISDSVYNKFMESLSNYLG